MAKRRKSTKMNRYQSCMSKRIPEQRKILMRKEKTKKLTRQQNNDALRKAAAICTSN